jgi:hypothetical protein
VIIPLADGAVSTTSWLGLPCYVDTSCALRVVHLFAAGWADVFLFIHFVAGSRSKSHIQNSNLLVTSSQRCSDIGMPRTVLRKYHSDDVIFCILTQHGGVVFVVLAIIGFETHAFACSWRN